MDFQDNPQMEFRALDIDHLGAKTAGQLVEKSLVKTPEKLIDADEEKFRRLLENS